MQVSAMLLNPLYCIMKDEERLIRALNELADIAKRKEAEREKERDARLSGLASLCFGLMLEERIKGDNLSWK